MTDPTPFIACALVLLFIGFVLGRITAPTRTIRVTRTTSEMTPEQQEAFDRAFSHMDGAFDEMRKVFNR